MTRGLLVLAMLAALLGAPRPASAAVNDLSAAQVSPAAGTVATTFMLRVSYEGNFPATAVSVSVAGTARPMALEHGTLTSGTWALATTLPAGTWTPTFAASVLRGSSPTRVGPTISVAELAVTAPTAAPSSGATTPRSSASIDEGGEAPASADPPAVAPAASVEVAPAGEPETGAQTSPDAEPGSEGAISAPGESAPRASHGDPGGDSTGDAAPASPTDPPVPESAEAPVPRPTATPNRDAEAGAPVAGDGASSGGARTRSPIGTDELLETVLIFGLIGVAAVALVGTLLMAIGRRRADDEEPAAVAVGAAPEVTATDDLLTRRTLRRARMRLGDDPIVSALGVDEQMRARRARRTRPGATDGRPSGEA